MLVASGRPRWYRTCRRRAATPSGSSAARNSATSLSSPRTTGAQPGRARLDQACRGHRHLSFEPAVAQQVAADVDRYPYFIQKYGEALWDAADAANLPAITAKLYASTRSRVQDALEAEFFEGRHLDAPAPTSSPYESPPASAASDSRRKARRALPRPQTPTPPQRPGVLSECPFMRG
jgi:hypothetical protein